MHSRRRILESLINNERVHTVGMFESRKFLKMYDSTDNSKLDEIIAIENGSYLVWRNGVVLGDKKPKLYTKGTILYVDRKDDISSNVKPIKIRKMKKRLISRAKKHLKRNLSEHLDIHEKDIDIKYNKDTLNIYLYMQEIYVYDWDDFSSSLQNTLDYIINEEYKEKDTLYYFNEYKKEIGTGYHINQMILILNCECEDGVYQDEVELSINSPLYKIIKGEVEHV